MRCITHPLAHQTIKFTQRSVTFLRQTKDTPFPLNGSSFWLKQWFSVIFVTRLLVCHLPYLNLYLGGIASHCGVIPSKRQIYANTKRNTTRPLELLFVSNNCITNVSDASTISKQDQRMFIELFAAPHSQWEQFQFWTHQADKTKGFVICVTTDSIKFIISFVWSSLCWTKWISVQRIAAARNFCHIAETILYVFLLA